MNIFPYLGQGAFEICEGSFGLMIIVMNMATVDTQAHSTGNRSTRSNFTRCDSCRETLALNEWDNTLVAACMDHKCNITFETQLSMLASYYDKNQ
jgi:hypothetical protein